jgi:hypothetical protein
MNRKFAGQGKKRWQETPQGEVILEGVKEICDRFFPYLKDPKIREDFFMQELDGAYSGNAASKKWVRNLGIPKERWKGALDSDTPEPEEIQQILTRWILANSLQFKKEEMAQIRRNIVSFLLLGFPVKGFDFGDFYERETGKKYEYKGPVF